MLISVGLHGEQPLLVDEAARGAPLRLIGWNWVTYLWLAVFAAMLGIFLRLAYSSDILRGTGTPDARGKPPYSMARAQAAYWLFLSIMSFVYIWVVTGDLTSLNGSVLTLLGISAGTYLASTMLDKPVPSAAGQDKDAAAKLAAAAVQAAGPGQPAVAALAHAAVQAAGAGQAAVAALEAAAGQTAKSGLQRVVTNLRNILLLGRFLEDILTEEDGVSVHRFQIFVWTIVLGIIFVISVGQDLVMPEFSATLLGLLGISSATFLAPKIKPNP